MVYYHVLENEVILQVNGKHVTIKSDDDNYDKVLECIKNDEMEVLESLFQAQKNPLDLLAEYNNVEVSDGMVLIDGKSLPSELHNRLVSFAKKGIDVTPLIKFAQRLQANPSFNSRQMLFKFLEHNGHPLTKDGKFIAYKKVRTDFKDIHSGKFDNSLGNVVSMPRHEVDDNPNNTCSSGLHVGAYNYTANFGSGYLLSVEVDPADVVAVPNDYNGEKMRVCKYKTLEIVKEIIEEELYDNFDEDFDDEAEEYTYQ